MATTNYIIEEVISDMVIIREEEKKYFGMFKYDGSHWCYFLPFRTMYLSDLETVKKQIERSKQDDKNFNWKAEYKIIEIKN